MQCGNSKVNSALSQIVNSVWGRLIIFRGPSGTRWKNIDFGEFLRSAHGGYHGFAPGLPCCIRQPTKSHHHYQHHHNNYGTNIATIGTSNKCYTHQNIKASTAVFLTALVGCVNIWILLSSSPPIVQNPPSWTSSQEAHSSRSVPREAPECRLFHLFKQKLSIHHKQRPFQTKSCQFIIDNVLTICFLGFLFPLGHISLLLIHLLICLVQLKCVNF